MSSRSLRAISSPPATCPATCPSTSANPSARTAKSKNATSPTSPTAIPPRSPPSNSPLSTRAISPPLPPSTAYNCTKALPSAPSGSPARVLFGPHVHWPHLQVHRLRRAERHLYFRQILVSVMHNLLGSDRLRQIGFDHVAAIQARGFRPCRLVGDELQRFPRALYPQPRRGFQSCDF